MSDDDFVTPIEVVCEGRKLQLRRDQLNVANLSKLSHVAQDTLYLISDDDFVALPNQDGQFPSLQSYRTWRVEGMSMMTNKPPVLEQISSSSYRWKPKPIVSPLRTKTNVPALTTEPIIQQVCIILA